MLRELNLFLYKTFSFVLMNLHSFWPPKGKPSIYFDSIFISGAIFFLFVLGHGNQMVLYDKEWNKKQKCSKYEIEPQLIHINKR